MREILSAAAVEEPAPSGSGSEIAALSGDLGLSDDGSLPEVRGHSTQGGPQRPTETMPAAEAERSRRRLSLACRGVRSRATIGRA